VEELATDPLELPRDVEFPRVEVDRVPWDADHLSLAKTEHEDQDVRGVERVALALGRLQEATRLLDRPRLDLALTRLGDLDEHELAELRG
jgi:hypothetical protein